LNVAVAMAVLPYLVPPFAVGLAGLAILWRKGSHVVRQADLANPLQFVPALQMALTFQVGLFAARLPHPFFGTSGLLATGALLGLHDVDALTISMSKNVSAGLPAALAAQAIGIGVMANCVTKAGIALALGAKPFRRVVAFALALMAVAIAIV